MEDRPSQSEMQSKGHAFWWRGLFFFSLSALMVATHYPELAPPDIAPTPVPNDKLVHFVAYAGLTFLAFMAFVRGRSRPKLRLWVLLTAMAVLGWIDEVTQPWTGRGYDTFDVLADTYGAWTMVLLLIPSRHDHRPPADFADGKIDEETDRLQEGNRLVYAALAWGVLLAVIPLTAQFQASFAAVDPEETALTITLMLLFGLLWGGGATAAAMRCRSINPLLDGGIRQSPSEIRKSIPGYRPAVIVLSFFFIAALVGGFNFGPIEASSTGFALTYNELVAAWSGLLIGGWLILGLTAIGEKTTP